MPINYEFTAPDPQTFIEFRAKCGWGRIDLVTAHAALKNSLVVQSVFGDESLIGFGRVIGDGALNYYVQDLIVKPEFQGQMIGSRILQNLMSWIRDNACKGASLRMI